MPPAWEPTLRNNPKVKVVVPPVGLEPTLAAYLALRDINPLLYPLSYGGVIWARITPVFDGRSGVRTWAKLISILVAPGASFACHPLSHLDPRGGLLMAWQHHSAATGEWTQPSG